MPDALRIQRNLLFRATTMDFVIAIRHRDDLGVRGFDSGQEFRMRPSEFGKRGSFIESCETTALPLVKTCTQ